MATLTSVDSYRRVVLDGKATSQRERILAFVRYMDRRISRAEIAHAFSLDWYRDRKPFPTTFDGGPPIPLASVCARVFVLVQSGLLRELKGAGRGPQGDAVNLVEAVTPAPVQRTFRFPTGGGLT